MIDAFERDEIEVAVDLLIERLNECDGDPDREEGEVDCCAAGDDDPRGFFTDLLPGDADDAEDDTEDCCPAGDDGCGAVWRDGVLQWGAWAEDALAA